MALDPDTRNQPPPPSRGKRLRARLRRATLTRVPLGLSRGRLGDGSRLRQLHVIERELVLPDLPDELHGLRMVHLSDLHTGDLLPVERVADIVTAANELEADLIALTGDFIDYHLDGVVEPLIEQLARLTAPLGVVAVLGNHDHLVDGPRLAEQLRATDLTLLIDERITVRRGDTQIAITGIDFARTPAALGRHLRRAGTPPEADLNLLLSHHPDVFDAGEAEDYDITLAGHTHGGQVVVSRHRGRKGSMGLGSLAFRYPHGLYHRHHRYLHVTAGVGSWFPLRVRCPAEIAVLTLRSGPEPDEGPSQPASATVCRTGLHRRIIDLGACKPGQDQG
ncbi:MAG: metallophosphoesterase [Phycisphaeraceae bacterium]|nr:metallophosphoesterase [Phycisphaeraceae bacterium]